MCVNSMVESLEGEEEAAEFEFFTSERNSIQREFQQRLDDIRVQLVNIQRESADTHSSSNGNHNNGRVSNASGTVTLLCGPSNTSVTCTHGEITDCAVHDGQQDTYALPTVAPRTVSMVLQFIRRRQAATSGGRSSSAAELTTIDIIPDDDVPACVDLTNILQYWQLFILLAARAYAARGDLSFLHVLIRDSALHSEHIRNVLRLQDTLLHQIQAVATSNSKRAAEGVVDADAIKAVFNMYWYIKCMDHFRTNQILNTHLKLRSNHLHAALNTNDNISTAAATPSSPSSAHHCDWLEPALAVTSPSDGSPSRTTTAVASSPAPETAPMLWCRIYMEILFSRYVSGLPTPVPTADATNDNPDAQPFTDDDIHRLAQGVGFLVHFLWIQQAAVGTANASSTGRQLLQRLVRHVLVHTVHARAIVLQHVTEIDLNSIANIIATAGMCQRLALIACSPTLPSNDVQRIADGSKRRHSGRACAIIVLAE